MQTGHRSALFTDLPPHTTAQVQGGWWAYHQSHQPTAALPMSPCDSSRDPSGTPLVPGYHYGYYGQ